MMKMVPILGKEGNKNYHIIIFLLKMGQLKIFEFKMICSIVCCRNVYNKVN
jgi:hypothetical protein